MCPDPNPKGTARFSKAARLRHRQEFLRAQAQGKRPLLWRIAAAQGRAALAGGDRAAAKQAFATAAEEPCVEA